MKAGCASFRLDWCCLRLHFVKRGGECRIEGLTPLIDSNCKYPYTSAKPFAEFERGLCAVMTREKTSSTKIASLLQSLDQELGELESAFNLQFDSASNLHDKLAASKRARTALKKSRRLRDLIAQSLSEREE